MAVQRAAALLAVAATASVSHAVVWPVSKWREATANTSTGVARLLPEFYADAVLNGPPRDYNVVVLFTANEAKYGCAACQLMAKEFIIAARSHAAAHGVNLQPLPWSGEGSNETALASTAPYDAASDDRVTFFGVVDVKYNPDAFAMHDFKTAPYMAVFPASDKKVNVFETRQRVVIPPERLHAPTSGVLDAAEILARVPGEPGLVPVRPAGERQSWALAAAVLVAVAGALVAWNRANLTIWRQRWFWTAASFVVYGVSISGVILCVIKNPPWYGTGRGADAKPSFFSGSSGHDQYVLEGLVIGSLNLGAAAAAIACVSLARSRRASTFVQVVLGALAIALFAAFYLRILGFYQQKTSWYRVEALASPGLRRSWARAYAAAAGWVTNTALPALVDPVATANGWLAAMTAPVLSPEAAAAAAEAAVTSGGKRAKLAAARAAATAAQAAADGRLMALVTAGVVGSVGSLYVLPVLLSAVASGLRRVLGCGGPRGGSARVDVASVSREKKTQ